MVPTQRPEMREIVLEADNDDGWEQWPLDGLQVKVLWKNPETGGSICLLRYRKGTRIPIAHVHASNQFMYCLRGRYAYPESDIVLTPGTFYMNPKDHPHGPAEALEDSVLIEIYDGPHYYETPGYTRKL